jgi:hypothetical protein
MNKKSIKKALAGMGIAGLIVGSSIVMSGCKSACGAGSCAKGACMGGKEKSTDTSTKEKPADTGGAAPSAPKEPAK